MSHFPAKAGAPLLEKRARAFAPVFGGRADAERRGFEAQAFFQARNSARRPPLPSPAPAPAGALASTLRSQARLIVQQLRLRHHGVHQADAVRLRRR